MLEENILMRWHTPRLKSNQSKIRVSKTSRRAETNQAACNGSYNNNTDGRCNLRTYYFTTSKIDVLPVSQDAQRNKPTANQSDISLSSTYRNRLTSHINVCTMRKNKMRRNSETPNPVPKKQNQRAWRYPLLWW